jgi:hypothetical protein
MQYNSGLPDWFLAAFAHAGDKNTIPANTSTEGLAALNTGWPAICSIPPEAGGISPKRKDFNGILYWLSLAVQRVQAGGFMPYNAAFATAIEGYPKGALVRKANGTGYWMSTADSNATDPDGATPSNWTDSGLGKQFTSSLGTSGYKKIPDPNSTSGYFIFQWFAGTVPASTSLTWTYPMSFPGEIYGVFPVSRELGETVYTIGTPSLTSAVIDNDPGTSTTAVFVFAIGV